MNSILHKPTAPGSLAYLFISFVSLLTVFAEEDIAIYDLGSQESDWHLWASDGSHCAAQPFTTGELGNVSSVSLLIERNGSPTGTMTLEVWDDSNGEPNDFIASVGELDLASLPATKQLVTINKLVEDFDPRTTYHLVLNWSSANIGTGGNDTFNVYCSDAAPDGNPAGNAAGRLPDESWLSVVDRLIDIGVASEGQSALLHMIITEDQENLPDEIIVINTNDDGPGSLRQAIADADDGAVISFDPSLAAQPIILGGTQLLIDKNLTIDASGVPGGITIDAKSHSRVMEIAPGSTVVIDSLIITGGRPPFHWKDVAEMHGGGILNKGNLTILRSNIVQNRCSDGTLGQHICEGDEENRDAGHGGGIYNSGTLTIEASTIANNQSGDDGSEWTLSAEGGGIYSTGTLLIRNSTISNNRSGPEDGFSSVDGIYSTGNLTIENSTITNSFVGGWRGHTGRVICFVPEGEAQCSLQNSILAGSENFWTFQWSPLVCTPPQLLGRNLISYQAHIDLPEGPNLIIADPKLAPLGDYGGPTPTMPPLPGSPAIDVFDDPLEAATDQRGFPIVGDRDLGAVEYQGDSDFARLFHVDYDQDGNCLGIEQALSTDPFIPDQNHPNNLTRPTFNGNAQPVLTFGLNTAAHPDTTWILERTTDLITFEKIYSFDGTTDVAIEGLPIEVNRTDERITITDEAPPSKGAFYRFKAVLSE